VSSAARPSSRPGLLGRRARLAAGVALVAGTALAAQAPPDDAGSATFSVRASGEPHPELAREVLQVLRAADREYRDRLGFGPQETLRVVLENEILDDAPEGLPGWADGLYDGSIRVPAVGMDRVTPRLAAVLRHELAHSFLHLRTRGNCPAWLQEGVAQWLEGGAPEREDRSLAALARRHELPALVTMEAPFSARDEDQDQLRDAYAASLSAAAHILRTRGVAGLRRLVESLGAGLPSDEALPNALGLSYAQLQRSWEEHLSGLDEPDGSAAGSEG
jgi:hypothetical protein